MEAQPRPSGCPRTRKGRALFTPTRARPFMAIRWFSCREDRITAGHELGSQAYGPRCRGPMSKKLEGKVAWGAGGRGGVFAPAGRDRLSATVKQQKGRHDVLFANAGVAAPAPRGKKHATPASASAWYAAAERARVSSSSIPERQA